MLHFGMIYLWEGLHLDTLANFEAKCFSSVNFLQREQSNEGKWWME